MDRRKATHFACVSGVAGYVAGVAGLAGLAGLAALTHFLIKKTMTKSKVSEKWASGTFWPSLVPKKAARLTAVTRVESFFSLLLPLLLPSPATQTVEHVQACGKLPDMVLYMIFANLDFASLSKCREISKRWKVIIDNANETLLYGSYMLEETMPRMGRFRLLSANLSPLALIKILHTALIMRCHPNMICLFEMILAYRDYHIEYGVYSVLNHYSFAILDESGDFSWGLEQWGLKCQQTEHLCQITGVQGSRNGPTPSTPRLCLISRQLGATPIVFKWCKGEDDSGYFMWSPDGWHWMPTSTSTVIGGVYNGIQPAIENINVINALDMYQGQVLLLHPPWQPSKPVLVIAGNPYNSDNSWATVTQLREGLSQLTKLFQKEGVYTWQYYDTEYGLVHQTRFSESVGPLLAFV